MPRAWQALCEAWESVTFRGVLLTVNLVLLGEAGLFLGSHRPGGSAGQFI